VAVAVAVAGAGAGAGAGAVVGLGLVRATVVFGTSVGCAAIGCQHGLMWVRGVEFSPKPMFMLRTGSYTHEYSQCFGPSSRRPKRHIHP
jgi:hypothetical protein